MGGKPSSLEARMILAAAKGEDEMVTHFLDDGAEINAVDDEGKTALYHAVKHNHRGIVRYLLSQGADPNLKSVEGRAPIHLAAQCGSVHLCSLLIESPGKKTSMGLQDKWLNTPLHKAAEKDHARVIDYLLVHGASQDIVNKDNLKPVDLCTKERSRRLLTKDTKKEKGDSARRAYLDAPKQSTWSKEGGLSGGNDYV